MTTVKLQHPILLAGETVDELTIRRPKLKDLKGIDTDRIAGDGLITLLARLTGLPERLVEEIDAADLDEIGGVLKDFFGRSPGAGATS